ncbi:hypothetical protein B0E52_13230 [Rhodanobacter sp. C06]|nr:hypothetical protein B0E52_13230 [Rhodanobacter sp. C06]
MGALEPGINRQGGDLSNFEANTAGECSSSCLADSRCRAMTFVKHPNAPGGICWLKTTVPSMSQNPSMTSAVKHDP